MQLTKNEAAERIGRISGVDAWKCMACGKCSGTCPAFDEMDIHPHRFVALVEKGELAALAKSKSLWICLSCFACVERCPRGVEPARLIEAVRDYVIRRQGENHLKPDAVPALADERVPQQLVVSALRKYGK